MKTRQNPILFYLGNVLILVSIVLSISIYYPLLALFIVPKKIESQVAKKGIFITIPKINAQAPVILNVDPWNKGEYSEKLREGVAHAKNTYIPGERGTSFLFAHSSDNPWNMTRNNTAFFRLSELRIHDEIIITINGRQKEYNITEIKEVFPTDTQYLRRSTTDQLILQTCTPIGTDFKRLLIFAKPE